MENFYKNIEHTGDLGVEVWGASREELFGHASLALTDTIVSVDKIIPKREAAWTIEAENLEELLVRQLQEILFRMDSDGMVFSEFRISLRGANSMQCLALGEPLDRERHGFKTEIKAVTYHQLKVVQEGDRWVARIIFDV
jgi:SHS2 domain-containing protein